MPPSLHRLITNFFAIVFIVASFLFSQNVALAAVAHDATSESHPTGTTGSQNQSAFSWTHTPTGTPRGVLVHVFTVSGTKLVTGVTYGGVPMTEITGGAAADTAGEPGRVDTYFLGSSIPTGAQTIAVTRTNNATSMYAVASTQTASNNTEIYTPGIVLLQESGTYAEQSVTDGSTGVDSVRYAAGYYGANNVLPAGTGSTLLNSIDFGSYTANEARETTAGQGARNVGFTGTSDDRAAVHLAVREAPVIPTVTSPTVTSITSTGATLGANVTSLGIPASISARGTCWGTSPAPTTNCIAEGGTTTGIFTHARSGMTPGVLYYYRGYATNTTGTGYSADGTFTTLSITGSVSASPSTCTILSGASTCTVPFTWSISNATSPNLYNATTATTYSTSASGAGVSYPITNGSNTVQARDSSTVLASTSVTASCESGSSWNGSMCAATPTVPTVTSPTVTSITSTGATLGANVTSLGIPASISARGTCWGTSPAPTTNCIAEGGTTTGIFTHARSGMTPGVLYYYRGYATNTTGTGYSADGTFTTTAPITTIGDGTTPGSAIVAPESGLIDLDYFTLQTNTGSDTATAAIITLSPAGAFNNIAQVDITDNSNNAVCTAVVNPSSITVSFASCNISATDIATTYKVRITPKTHAAMPVPPGASYTTTGTVTSFTSTNSHSGTDNSSATITIDNLSPGATSGELVSAGDAQAGVSWTNPIDADFSNIVVLRDTVTIGSGSKPAEGSSPTVGSSCGGIACQVRYILSGTSFTDTGLTNGTTYYYRIFTKDTHGNYTTYTSTQEVSGTPTATPTTTLGAGTDPASTTVAPGAPETDVNEFTLQTNTGTEAITSISINLSTNDGVAVLALTNTSNATIGSVTPVAGLNTIPVNISVGTSGTTLKVRVTPKVHTVMPAAPGAAYVITAPITTWAGSYAHTGTDTNTNALTIDNLSPSNVPAASVTAGNTQVSVSWTNPTDADFTTGGTVIVLRNTSAVTDTPTEGATYAAGNSLGASTVACVTTGTPPGTSCTDTGLTNDIPYYYKIFTQDSNGNYSATGAIPSNSPATPSVIVLPTFAITATAGSGGTVLPAGVTNVTQGNSQTYIITPNSGYSIDTLTIDGATTTPATSYTFTNVQTAHTIAATFVTQGEATAGGGIRLARITFTGKAFAGGKVSIVQKELDTENLSSQQDISTVDGTFRISFADIPKNIFGFGLLAKDPEGRTSQTKFFLLDARDPITIIKDIVIPPTVDILNGQVSRGGNVKIFGYASPSHSIRLYIDDIMIKEALAGRGGVYSFDIPTGALEFGQHRVRAKQINLDIGKESDFSTTRTFIVSKLAIVKADLNGDGKVDIKDWSIFLARWGSKTSLGRTGIDLNGDGKIDIGDFSIFIKTIRK